MYLLTPPCHTFAIRVLSRQILNGIVINKETIFDFQIIHVCTLILSIVVNMPGLFVPWKDNTPLFVHYTELK